MSLLISKPYIHKKVIYSHAAISHVT